MTYCVSLIFFCPKDKYWGKKMILMYHRVSDRHRDEGSCTGLYAFVCEMLSLKKRLVVTLDEYNPAESNQVVITFDDAYHDVWLNAVPLLKHLNYPFEVFVVGRFLENRNCMDRNILSSLCRNTMGRLQFHGNEHRELKDIETAEDILAEIIVPDDLRQLDPEGFRWFAYPYCSYNRFVIAEIQKRYQGAVSGKGLGSDHIYALERLKITDKSDRKEIFPALTLGEKGLAIIWYLRLKLFEILRKR